MRGVFARIVLTVAALVVAGWLALGLASAVLTERGKDRLLDAVAAAPGAGRTIKFRQAERDLDRATALNPDRVPVSLQAQALAGLGDKVRARELADQVVREEPDDVEVLGTAQAVALAIGDRRLQAEVARRMRELNPRGAIR